MKTNPQSVVIAAMAVVIAVLAWGLIYFARDEWRLAAEAPANEIPVKSAIGSEDGFATVRIAVESQQASGIALRSLDPARVEAATEVYGVIVSVQPLIDLRSRYLSAVSDARALRAAAANSATEYQRMKRLFDDDRNVSERVVQAAETLWKADQAKLAAADQSVAAAHDSIRAGWGEVLAG
jgi:multidrug efflux system membrane fusion protein